MPWLIWADKEATRTAEDTFRFLDRIAKKWETGAAFDFGIFLNGKFCGRASVFDLSAENKSGEFGYWLAQDAARKGLASASVRALEKECFLNRGFNRLQIKCDKRNVSSADLARRLGYIQEAKLREERFSKIEKIFITTLVFSKLKKDFAA